MQTAQYSDLAQPQTVKIFGIMHVILASLGLLMTVWTVFVLAVGNPFENMFPQTPQMAAQAKAQAAMQEDIMPITVISTILTVIVAAIMLRAGILLLKKRGSGLLWSNRYAWSSLATKAVNIVLAIIYTVPAIKKMAPTMAGGLIPVGQLEMIMIVTALLSIVVMCAYPILTLILLNRRNTKEWFANRPD